MGSELSQAAAVKASVAPIGTEYVGLAVAIAEEEIGPAITVNVEEGDAGAVPVRSLKVQLLEAATDSGIGEANRAGAGCCAPECDGGDAPLKTPQKSLPQM
jgi:hypothetical protein